MLHTECLSLPRSVVTPLSSFLCCPNQLQLTSKSCSRLHTLRGHSRLPLCYFRSCSSAYKASVRCSSSAKVDMGITSGADDVAIVLVDHGSRRAEANAMLEDFADLYRFADLPPSIPREHIQDVLAYRGHSGRRKVEIAHMELAEPSIGAAVAKCVSEGYRKVVVAPYFLARGRHITSDIPAMVAEAQKAHPELSCVIAEPIGLDPLMAELIEKRVEGALQIS